MTRARPPATVPAMGAGPPTAHAASPRARSGTPRYPLHTHDGAAERRCTQRPAAAKRASPADSAGCSSRKLGLDAQPRRFSWTKRTPPQRSNAGSVKSAETQRGHASAPRGAPSSPGSRAAPDCSSTWISAPSLWTRPRKLRRARPPDPAPSRGCGSGRTGT